MSLEAAIGFLIAIAILAGLGWLAKWVIDAFFKEGPARNPAMLITGVFLLVCVLYLALDIARGGRTVSVIGERVAPR